MAAPSVIDQINYSSKNQLKNGVTTVLYDLSISIIIASRLIIQSLATTDLCHHVKPRDLSLLIIFLFFLSVPNYEGLTIFYIRIWVLFISTKKKRKKAKSRLSIARKRRVNAHCLDISQATVVAAQIFGVLFLSVCDCQSKLDFVRIVIK
jgi:hypothetical protein